MRQIKYRGKVDGTWWYVTPDQFIRWKHFWAEVDRKTVGQYTGLKNKSGTEIYEGDILLVADTKWTVAWHRHENGMTGWMVKDSKIHHWYVIDTSILRGEVVGIIHDNSELLKVNEPVERN